MRIYLMYLFLVFSTFYLQAQSYQGRVLDSVSKEPLEFVQIGIINSSKGVLSNERGQFRLNKQQVRDSDSLIFSYLGYETEIISFKDLQSLTPLELLLKKQVFDLPKINIQADALSKSKKIGYKNTTAKRMQTGWSGYGSERNVVDNPVGERGSIIKLKGKTAFIKNVNFHLANNEYDSIVCRIHLYSVKNGLPDKELTRDNIFVKTAQKQGWVKVPIDHLQLVVKEDVIATVEWVKAWKKEPITGEGLHFSLGFFGKLIWRETTHQTNWRANKIYHLGIYLDTKTN